MRIISGKYRGKKLKEFELDSTKPTLDRVKESIFNLIQFDVADSVVLDLFAGTGALGIEAISRGAKLTHFVDFNPKAIKIINQNLEGVSGDYKVFDFDYETYLSSTIIKYDIIFLDPPYKTDFALKALNLIITNNLLNKNGIIIIETTIENNLEFNLDFFDVKKKEIWNCSCL